MNIYNRPALDKIRSLLVAARLPVADLAEDPEHFLACGPADDPHGIVGLELLGDIALLRSLAVRLEHRGKGCGVALVTAIERYARQHSAEQMYLLTETAVDFFERHGYRVVRRGSAPGSIRQTREYSSLCPASAVLMHKML